MKTRYFIDKDSKQLRGKFYKDGDTYIVDFSGNIWFGGYFNMFLFVRKEHAEAKLQELLTTHPNFMEIEND